MTREPYGTLASVYEWLLPEALLTPEGAVAAFAEHIAALEAGARVLDCAAGTGLLAVGLVLRGFEVVASDASGAMLERASRLAADYGIDLPVVVARWDQLVQQGWTAPFEAVFCVGNSLAHAPGRVARRAALRQMAAVLRPGGLLVLTSRNWEQVREKGSGLSVADELVERRGERGLVVHGWTIPEGWDEPHEVDVAVALIDGTGRVTSHGERLSFWPFRHEDLDADLRAAGLVPISSTYDPQVERYLVTAGSL
ncbi:MAG: class I SAM-dependent methyltransferase [Nitriliruptorales bacterium]